MYKKAGYNLTPLECDLKLKILNKSGKDAVTLSEIFTTEKYVSDGFAEIFEDGCSDSDLDFSEILCGQGHEEVEEPASFSTPKNNFEDFSSINKPKKPVCQTQVNSSLKLDASVPSTRTVTENTFTKLTQKIKSLRDALFAAILFGE
jgi:hypothetical protein